MTPSARHSREAWELAPAELEQLGFTVDDHDEPLDAHEVALADDPSVCSMSKRARLAVHESGHAVASWVLFGITSTILIDDAKGAATTTGQQRGEPAVQFADIAARDDDALNAAAARVGKDRDAFESQLVAELEAHQVVNLAGPIAEHNASELPLAFIYARNGRRDVGDWERHQQLLAALRAVDRERDWERTEKHTAALLIRNWHLVERLAEALGTRSSLSAREVFRILVGLPLLDEPGKEIAP